jgi:Sulfotransferase family
MSAGPGSSLVFLISQPRAGSTLLQRVLAGHPQIHSAGETWLMLPPLYALREAGQGAAYNGFLAQRALRLFLATLPDGPASYREGLRCMAEHVYTEAARGAGKPLFLDKTPRYYLVLPELRDVFPEARFVVLLRHPVAVLHSICETWVRPDWLSAIRFAQDIALAPRLLASGIAELGRAARVVHYERFVAEPEAETRRLCEELGIAFHPPMLRYADSALPRWELGDQKIYAHGAPVAGGAARWKAALAEPQFWRLARDHVSALGPETLAALGYPQPEIAALLEETRPARSRLAFTFSLDEVLGACPTPPAARSLRRLANAWAQRGLRGALLGAWRSAQGVRPPGD